MQELQHHTARAAADRATKAAYDALFARHKQRIHAAHAHNLAYVQANEAAARARGRAAAVAVTAGNTRNATAAAVEEARAREASEPGCIVYVANLPIDATWDELESHFTTVGAVSSVKMYRGTEGAFKGDALITYKSEASALGALQLLSGRPLRRGCADARTLQVSRPEWNHGLEGASEGIDESSPIDSTIQAPPHSRVIVLTNFLDNGRLPDPSQPVERCAFEHELVDRLWARCCQHGEVERIELLGGVAAGGGLGGSVSTYGEELYAVARFQEAEAAAAALHDLGSRPLAVEPLQRMRTPHVQLDDGELASRIALAPDGERQCRFGFGDAARAHQESLRILKLAAAAGAEFVRCDRFVADVDLYEFCDGEQGWGYYRRSAAPAADPRDYQLLLLQQAFEAGDEFIASPAELTALPGYEYSTGSGGVAGFVRTVRSDHV